MTRPWQRRTLGAAATLLVLSGLAACSDDKSDTPPSGLVTTGIPVNRDLPPDYPADQAPIIKGKINAVQRGEVDGHVRWQLLVEPQGDLETAVGKATSMLTDAGWTGEAQGKKAELTRDDGQSVSISIQDYRGTPNLYIAVIL
jgi:hypothetical protein